MKRLRSFLSRSKSGSADQKPHTGQRPPGPAAPQPPVPPGEGQPPAAAQQPGPPAPDAQPSPDVGFATLGTLNTLTIALVNKFPSGTTVYAIVTGRAISNNNALVLLRSDGRTPYFPASPSGTMSAVNPNDVAIRLGATGSTTNLTIPYIAGGRI